LLAQAVPLPPVVRARYEPLFLQSLRHPPTFEPEGAVSQSKRLVVETPWSQVTSECQQFGHPPRLNNSPF
jgi:hypothetical protein